MEIELRNRLLVRQLKDIQNQADRIMTGDVSEEDIQAFGNYSKELKRFIRTGFDSVEINMALNEIPDEVYNPDLVSVGIFSFFLPHALIAFYQQYHAKQNSIEVVDLIRSKYATIDFLIKAAM